MEKEKSRIQKKYENYLEQFPNIFSIVPNDVKEKSYAAQIKFIDALRVKDFFEKRPKGKSNAIYGKIIAQQLGFDPKNGNTTLRNLMKILLKAYDYPILSCHSGYYIGNCRKEFKDFILSETKRIQGMQNTVNAAQKILDRDFSSQWDFMQR